MKINKLISFVLCLVLLFSTSVIAYAEESLPESDHNYADDTFQEYTYSLGNAPYGIYISFSEETYFEPSEYSAETGEFKYGDSLKISADNGISIGFFTSDELAGAEIYVPTAGFSLYMITDESINFYGFKILSVRAAEKDEVYSVLCHPRSDNENDFTLCFSKRETVKSEINEYYSKYPFFYKKDSYLAGWAKEPYGKICFTPNQNPTEGISELWAVWIKLSLQRDEIFNFWNSSDYFCFDGKRNYYFTAEDKCMIHHNLYRTFGIAPYPTPIVSTVYTTFPYWNWRGSCFGVSAVTALQHYGIIDILPMQNAKTINEMQPDKELISFINYYQTLVPVSFPVEEKAIVRGSLLYKTQLQNLYRSAESGKIVLFSYNYTTPLESGIHGHSVLITGAYTNTKGEHILIAYDNNAPDVYQFGDNIDTVYTISNDWSKIDCGGFSDRNIRTIQWTDTFEHFRSFDISGKGPVVTWHQTYFRHLKNVFNMLWQQLAEQL